MTDLRQAAQQALEAMETNQYTVAELAPHKVVMKFNDAITALRKALAQPEQEPHSYCYVQRGSSVDVLTFDGQPQDAIAGTIYPLYAAPPAAQSEQEPTPWRDMVVATLVREGIDKHKARELADHFAAQPEQKPVSHSVIAGALFNFMGWLTSRKERLVLSSTDEASPAVDAITDFAKMRGLSLDDARVLDWHTTPPAAQRPWVGLTEFQFAEIYNAWNDTNGSTPWGLNQALEAKLRKLNT